MPPPSLGNSPNFGLFNRSTGLKTMTQKDQNPQRGLAPRSKSMKKMPTGRSFFFGIGINQYDFFKELNNAVNDVEKVVDLLQSKYDIEPENTLLISNQNATRKQIITAFDQLKETLQPADKLIVYFSGHGHLDKWNKGYWIPVDAELDNSAHYIRNSTILEYMGDIPAQHILLISDSCFSGSLFYKGQSRSTLAIDELETRKSRWAICSGRHDEEVADGPPGTHSPFAKSILYVLEQNERDKLNVSKVIEQVLEMTRANYKQLPEGSPLQGVDHRGGQYVFCRKGVITEVQVTEPAEVIAPTGGIFRQMVAQISSERKEVLQWLKRLGFYLLTLTSALLGTTFFLTENSTLGEIVLVLIPFLYYLAAYYPALFSRLSRKNLLVLTGGYAAIFFALLLLWQLNAGSWWKYLLMLAIGGGLYYFIIPLIGKSKNRTT